MAQNSNKVTVDMTTGIGILSFPRIFPATAGKNDKQETVYDCQIIIPKSQPDDCRAILKAIQTVGKAKWGDNWKKMKHPMRDGDKEKDDLCEDGETTKGEKYPERIGAYFLNVRSSKPVAVVGRDLSPLQPEDIYAGCRVKVSLSFYPYSNSGNHGIGAGLNGVQKIADGEAIGGGGKPSVESMFDLIEGEDDDLDLDAEIEAEVEETPPPAKKTAAKRAPAKKAAAKKAAAPVEEEEDDLADLDGADGDMFDDLDDDV